MLWNWSIEINLISEQDLRLQRHLSLPSYFRKFYVIAPSPAPTAAAGLEEESGQGKDPENFLYTESQWRQWLISFK